MADANPLLEPIKVGATTWKNRMVKAPSSLQMFAEGQHMTEQTYAAHEAFAAGGAAAVVVEASIFLDPGHPEYPFAGLYDDRFIPEWKTMADRIHAHDCKLIAQIFHYSAAFETEGGAICSTTVAEEDLPCPPPYYYPTRGVTIDEIEQIKTAFIDAAERCKKAGVDGIEVHVANGYFFLTFLSRVWNKRTDCYGGSIENRARLACEVIEGVRERCGDDFVIGVRMNGQEFGHPDALTIEESTQAAQLFERAGADYISVTGYGFGKVPFQYSVDYWNYPEPDPDMVSFIDRYKGDGLIIPAAAAIKQVVNIPVMSVGSGLDEIKAERLVGEGVIDIAGFARGIWADNDLPRKVAEGRPEDIRHCTHCGTCDNEGEPRRCRVNPAMGRENELKIVPTETPKNILVVGGGVAGMNSAITLAERGHHVVLCEKEGMLGSELYLATMVKGTETEKVPELIDWLTGQVRKNPAITVKTKTEVDLDFVNKMKPDEIVVATGGRYTNPDIEGIDLKNVSTVPDLAKLAMKPLQLFGAEALNKLSKIALPGVGKNVVVIGGQIEGLQGALFLQKRGKNVTVLEESDALGTGIPPRYLDRMMPYFDRHGVDLIKNVTLDKVAKKGVSYTDARGNERFIPCDTVMVFQSPVEDLSLCETLKASGIPVHAVGACLGEGHTLMVDAMRDSRELGVHL